MRAHMYTGFIWRRLVVKLHAGFVLHTRVYCRCSQANQHMRICATVVGRIGTSEHTHRVCGMATNHHSTHTPATLRAATRRARTTEKCININLALNMPNLSSTSRAAPARNRLKVNNARATKIGSAEPHARGCRRRRAKLPHTHTAPHVITKSVS